MGTGHKAGHADAHGGIGLRMGAEYVARHGRGDGHVVVSENWAKA